MKLADTPAMVGGCWSPETPHQAFIPLETDVDVTDVQRSGQMLETLLWDPCGVKACPLSMCSLPVKHNFSGQLASYRGSLYMLECIGKILLHDQNVVRGLVFDSAGSHLLLRNIMFGVLDDIPEEDLLAIPWFGQLEWRDLPASSLPRLPAAISLCQGEAVWCLPGMRLLACFRPTDCSGIQQNHAIL